MALVVKTLPAHAGDVGSIPGLGRSPGGGHSNPVQYSFLKNPMDRGAWWAAVHRVAKESDMTEATWHGRGELGTHDSSSRGLPPTPSRVSAWPVSLHPNPFAMSHILVIKIS